MTGGSRNKQPYCAGIQHFPSQKPAGGENTRQDHNNAKHGVLSIAPLEIAPGKIATFFREAPRLGASSRD
jgi:hypothetical protein